jgi:hypothetical protein
MCSCVKGVYVSLIGRNQSRVRQIATEVEKETEGRVVERRTEGPIEGEDTGED